eukprot:4660747-Amphidinium_carterae.1
MTEETRKQYVTLTVSFIVANVHSSLIGLPDLDFNAVTLHTGNDPYIERSSSRSISEDKIYLNMPITADHWRCGRAEQSSLCATTMKQPQQPFAIEMAKHRLTHMPYKDWCPIYEGFTQRAIAHPARTGMCYAMPATNMGATRHQITPLKKFVMENGFGGSIIQVDNDPATLTLSQTAAKELSMPWRSAAPHDHQSPGAIQRFPKPCLLK